jgi:hypothetical protein
MEFLSPEQKRQKTQRLFIGYALLTILVSLATYIMISTARGYEIFAAEGEIVQNGLLFVNTDPDGAQLFVNGKEESNATNTRLSLPEGNYTLTMKKAGYREWSSTIGLFGGQVMFLQYPRLLPLQPAIVRDVSVAESAQVFQSPDFRRVAIITGATLQLVDTEKKDTPAQAIALPGDLFDIASLSGLAFSDWSQDGTVILLAATLSNGEIHTVLLPLNQPELAVDLTKTMAIPPNNSPSFWSANGDTLLFKDAGGLLRSGDRRTNALAATPLVAEPVRTATPLNDTALVLTHPSDRGVVVSLKRAETSALLATIDTEKLSVDSGRYNRNDFVLVVPEGKKAQLFRNPLFLFDQPNSKISPFVTFPLIANAGSLSPGGRFAMVQNRQSLAVYDIEQKTMLRYDTPVKEDVQSLGWFDASRLFARTKNGAIVIWDFDGKNVYTLYDTGAIANPFVSGNRRFVSILQDNGVGSVLKTLDIYAASETK